MVRISTSYRIFSLGNYIFLALLSLACVLPIIHLFSESISDPVKVNAGLIGFFPQDVTLESYKLILQNKPFWQALFISVERVILGGFLGLFMTIITAYPLSLEVHKFPQRKYYVAYFFFVMIFNGGLVPTYLLVFYTGLIDSIWALIIPGVISIWNVILLLNFFRQLPAELSEAAFIDGAGHFRTLWQIIVPLSKPAIATILLFILVGHWNSWFDGLLYMNKPEHYPLQTYLYSMLSIDISAFISSDVQRLMNQVSPRTLQAAQIFIATFPILCAYPFLQKYFATGITLGSVKE